MRRLGLRAIALCVALIGTAATQYASSQAQQSQQQVYQHSHESVSSSLFANTTFTDNDSILVISEDGEVMYDWHGGKSRTPASVMKLVTAELALAKWGAEHRFNTDFYLHNESLWVKGSGDPMLISEELDRIVVKLKPLLPSKIQSLKLDSSLFNDPLVPGRGASNDPYNAPLAALSINFNTVSLKLQAGQVVSGEAQTPLTPLAAELAAKSINKTQIAKRPTRVNLKTANNAQRQFGQILNHKLDMNLTTEINQLVPDEAELLYRHTNSHSLADTLRGTLEFSNNFIANQLFLLLSDNDSLGFKQAQDAAQQQLSRSRAWAGAQIVDGAGLSRDNRLTAYQVIDVLNAFEPNRKLLKAYTVTNKLGITVTALAKSGTLSDVHSFAGFLEVGGENYKFVFLFNRKMPYKYRESLLKILADQLSNSDA